MPPPPPPPATDEQRDQTLDHLDLLKPIARRRATRLLPYDDAYQSGFLGLLRAVQEFVPTKGDFPRFAKRCVKTAIRDASRRSYVVAVPAPQLGSEEQGIRRALACGPIPEGVDFAVHDTGTEQVDARDAVEWGLGQLSARTAEIVRRSRLQGQSLRTVADDLGTSLTDAQYLASSGIRQLSNIMGGLA